MPAVWRMASRSATSALPNASFGGQLRSGETHPCHVICVDVPNDTLFMQAAVVKLPLRAAARSEKKRAVIAAERVNGFGVATALPPRSCNIAVEWPSDHTVI